MVEKSKDRDQSGKTQALKKELAQYRQQHAELLQRFDALTKQLQDKKIETFEQLAEQDREAKKQLVALAKQTAAAPLDVEM